MWKTSWTFLTYLFCVPSTHMCYTSGPSPSVSCNHSTEAMNSYFLFTAAVVADNTSTNGIRINKYGLF